MQVAGNNAQGSFYATGCVQACARVTVQAQSRAVISRLTEWRWLLLLQHEAVEKIVQKLLRLLTDHFGSGLVNQERDGVEEHWRGSAQDVHDLHT